MDRLARGLPFCPHRLTEIAIDGQVFAVTLGANPQAVVRLVLGQAPVLATAAIAGWRPARRAAAVDPVRAPRAD